MTQAEIVLWSYLKNGIDGLKVRRQHPISLYVADFYCHKAKLIIELDGLIHDDPDIKQSDELREKELVKMGYTIIRFQNQQVINDPEEVITIISEKISYLINLQKQKTPH